jgi:hypothetical protein
MSNSTSVIDTDLTEPLDDSFKQQFNDLIDDDDELSAVNESTPSAVGNPYRTVRTPEAQALVDEKKATGELPTGRKRRDKRTATTRDGKTLAFMAKMRVVTAEAISMLHAVDDVKHARHGHLIDPKTAARRLLTLENMGLVQSFRVAGLPQIYTTTKDGKDVAINFGLIGEHEVNPRGIKGMKTGELPHYMAVSQVAAQYISPRPYFLRDLDLGNLFSEYQATVSLQTQRERTKDNAGEAGFVENHGSWRKHALDNARSELNKGEYGWDLLTEYYPALWIPGQSNSAMQFGPRDDRQFFENHHLPDLIINREAKRTGSERKSFAIEVELSMNKYGTDYRKMMRTWYAEFHQVDGCATPSIYRGLIYHTNSQEVINILTKVDKEFNLMQDGFLRILPLVQRDGKTPLNLHNRIN